MPFWSLFLFFVSCFLSITLAQNFTACNPIIVGGMGGSGTRGVIAFLETAGMNPPKRVNKAGDIRLSSETPSLFLLADQVMAQTKSLWFEVDELSTKTYQTFQQVLSDIHRVCEPDSEVKWGFKSPNTMFMLPLWAEAYPNMCFLHVLRDGRDMAYSLRNRQSGGLFDSFFCESKDLYSPEIRQALFWQRANLQLFEKGKTYLNDRYHLVKIEDMMDEGSRFQSARTLLQNIGMGDVIQTPAFRKALTVFSTSLGGTMGTEVELEETYGKWRDEPKEDIRKLERVIIRGLRSFGYELSTRE